MSGDPYSADAIERVLGRRLRQLAEAKRRGGDSAGIGYRYEISVLVKLVMQAAVGAKDGGTDVAFHDQPLGFADDLLVIRNGVHEFYQIKSERSVPRLPRRQVVVRDLCLQVRLMRLLEQEADVILVVGDETVRNGYLEVPATEEFEVFVRSRAPLPQTAGRSPLITEAVRGLIGPSELASGMAEPSLVYHVCRAFKSALDACGQSGNIVEITDLAASSCRWIFGSGGLRPVVRDLELLESVAEVRWEVLGRCLLLESTANGRRSLLAFRDQGHWDAFIQVLSRARRQLTLETVLYGKVRLDER